MVIDQVTHLVDEEKAADVVYLDFSEALTLFPTASSWRNYMLYDGCTLRWVKKNG